MNHHLEEISKNYFKSFHSNKCIKLGDLFELKSGYAFKSKDWSDEGKPVIKIKDINGTSIDFTNFDYVNNKSELTKASNFKVFGEEIVMALTGATTGKIGVIPKNFKGYINQRVGLFYTKTNLSYAVLWSILQQENIITDLIELSSGSAQANLSPFAVNNYDLNITINDLIKLDKMLLPLYKLFCFNLSEIHSLSELRDTLLPKLTSGEIPVSQAAK
ncbi:restriction endonuclease subunit S [Streptococcus macacae]|uniref:restriction endonuclease subunit S n=1 Tax=Streptococcus macacae TaxID=1339 RepID=UPI002E166747